MKSRQVDSLPVPPIPSVGVTRDILLPILLLAAALAALPLDFAVGRWSVKGGCPGFFRELLEAAEPFGNGNGVIYIALALLALNWMNRRTTLRILTTAFGAGLAADLFKLTVERTRPCFFAYEGTIWDSIVGVFPLASAGPGGQSFPSAHTATAVGLAAALAWCYPRARVFFFLMAALVGMQRVIGGAHFISDTFCGAAIASVVASFTLRHERLTAWFDRYEASNATADDDAARPFPQKLVA